MISILKTTLDKIESLEYFYYIVTRNMMQEISDELKKNELGFLADMYFMSLFEDSCQDDVIPSELKEIVEKEIEVIDIEKLGRKL